MCSLPAVTGGSYDFSVSEISVPVEGGLQTLGLQLHQLTSQGDAHSLVLGSALDKIFLVFTLHPFQISIPMLREAFS